MAIDFQQVRSQVQQMGESALPHQQLLDSLRQRATRLLADNAGQLEKLRQQVEHAARVDKNLRCAVPVSESLDAHSTLPDIPKNATILAADGSQIFQDRHAEVDYCLINVGAIQMHHGSSQPPLTTTACRLFYYEDLYNLTESRLALRRDLHERTLLADLAEQAEPPVITFTDGPMELWASPEASEIAGEFQESLGEYLDVLDKLRRLGVTTAGYVDKPSADLVIRLLEVAGASEADLPRLRKLRPLRGVTDIELYKDILAPGERSAVFALQSQSAAQYAGPLALHFFYLNVGREGHPYLARVEMPAWVVNTPGQLDSLHAILVHQCQVMGASPYPYLLHRAHETAVVERAEQEQVTQMIILELLRRGVAVAGRSNKQVAKDNQSRTRYEK